MAKQIIVLDRGDNIQDKSWNVVLWCLVPAARQKYYAEATKTSAYKDASSEELADLKSGAVVEIPYQIVHINTRALADLKAELILVFNENQSRITNDNHFAKYGTFYDGIAWTSGGTL